jgi:glycosyltransferase involved in cell wall biosynthesis
MNILMISDVFHPRVNGVSTSMQTFRRDLGELGHHVHLVVPAYAEKGDEGGQSKKSDESNECEITRVASKPVPRDPEDRLMAWGSLCRQLDELATQPWDVIHVQTPFLAHYAGVRMARRTGVPLVLTYHTLFEEYLYHYVPVVPKAAMRLLARRLSVRQCGQADAVVVPSRAMAERLHGYGVASETTHVLPTGLPPACYELGNRAAFRAAHDIPADRPVALFVGRAAHEKNIGFLLEAMQTVTRRLPQALLLIAGEGPAVAQLHLQARQLGIVAYVRFLGYLRPGSALADCYSAADVFVFASRTETQGLVLLEAMAQGLPALALAEMGTHDILDDCPGAVIGRDLPADFGIQLAELLADPQRLAALRVAAREWAERWKSDAQARRLLELYASLRARHATALKCHRAVTPAG